MCVEKVDFAAKSVAQGNVGAELGVGQELSVAESWMVLFS